MQTHPNLIDRLNRPWHIIYQTTSQSISRRQQANEKATSRVDKREKEAQTTLKLLNNESEILQEKLLMQKSVVKNFKSTINSLKNIYLRLRQIPMLKYIEKKPLTKPQKPTLPTAQHIWSVSKNAFNCRYLSKKNH